jgi:hypothetical protein
MLTYANVLRETLRRSNLIAREISWPLKFLRGGIFSGKPVKYIITEKYNGFSMALKPIKYNFKCVCMWNKASKVHSKVSEVGTNWLEKLRLDPYFCFLMAVNHCTELKHGTSNN